MYENTQFFNIFDGLLNIVKVVFKYSKGTENDKIFKEEKALTILAEIINTCFNQQLETIMELTKKKVGTQVISNDDNLFDLVIYSMGTIKNVSSNAEIAANLLQNNFMVILKNAYIQCLSSKNTQKKPQLLVQITGALRNLATDPKHFNLILQNKLISKMIETLEKFSDHKELVLNISRILSKIS